MKKVFIVVVLLVAFITLVACGSDGDMSVPTTTQNQVTQNENSPIDDIREESTQNDNNPSDVDNEEPPTMNLPAEEPSVMQYSIIIDGIGFEYSTYIAQGEQLPTHVQMCALRHLGIIVEQGGVQVSLAREDDGSFLGVWLTVVNYLAFGEERLVVSVIDTFMLDDGYFTQYVPILLLEELGFSVYFDGCSVHINGQLNVQTNPHPLAVALYNFNANAQGETKAFQTAVDGIQSIVAIEFVDTHFAEATLFVYTTVGDVVYKKIGNIDGFPLSLGLTTDGWGNLLKLTGDGGNRSYTMYGISPDLGFVPLEDAIIYLFTIYAERADDGSINYYQYYGGWSEGLDGGRFSITEEDFYAIFNEMGSEIISWRDGLDGTEQILARIARFPNW